MLRQDLAWGMVKYSTLWDETTLRQKGVVHERTSTFGYSLQKRERPIAQIKVLTVSFVVLIPPYSQSEMADAHPQATSFECPMDFCVEFWNLAKKWYKDPYVVYKFVFIIAIPALLVIFGIVGNLLSFAVLATRKLTSATLLLRVLAIADTSVLISIFLFHSLPHLEKLNMI